MNKAYPSLKDLVVSMGVNPKKSLGQNFIFDYNILNKIVSMAGKLDNEVVLEVGPGPGGLTRCILDANVKKLYVIEQDERCLKILERLQEQYPDKLEIIIADALKIKEEDIIVEGKFHVISNLPYNIGTELLFKWLDKSELVKSMTLMFQKEVADRIIAQPRTKAYGRLSILSQWLCDVTKAFDLPPTVFYPPPKVVSSLLNFKIKESLLFQADKNNLEQITKILFSKRRKMIRAVLHDLNADFLQLATHGIIETMRAEELTVEQFCYLSEVISCKNTM
jgi:16S rRNA (adenine1518-N6/adenine1519-N6)-dimethyltransferase